MRLYTHTCKCTFKQGLNRQSQVKRRKGDFISPLVHFHWLCLCAGSEYGEITQTQGQGGRATANLHERWMGREAGRVEVGGLEMGTVISLGCTVRVCVWCVYVCAQAHKRSVISWPLWWRWARPAWPDNDATLLIAFILSAAKLLKRKRERGKERGEKKTSVRGRCGMYTEKGSQKAGEVCYGLEMMWVQMICYLGIRAEGKRGGHLSFGNGIRCVCVCVWH